MKSFLSRSHLLEFILVFSAVILGFFAENLREYYSDKSHEKDFLQSLVRNLKTDSTTYANRDSASRVRTIWMDTLISILTLNKQNRNAEAYLLARYSTRLIPGRPGLSTLNFLAKSDEYIHLSDDEVKEHIQRYEARLKWLENLTDLEEEMSRTLWQDIPLIFDTKVFAGMKMNNDATLFEMPDGDPPFINTDRMMMNKLAYHLYLRRSQFNSEVANRRRIDNERKDLINFLVERYELR